MDQLYHDESMFKGAKPETFRKAQILRKNMTLSELKLWELLKNKESVGYRFRRQHPLGHYILDFYNHELKLCIEVDGKYHESVEQKQYDKERDEFLNFNGIEVIRFKNTEIENDIEKVINKIKNVVERKSTL